MKKRFLMPVLIAGLLLGAYVLGWTMPWFSALLQDLRIECQQRVVDTDAVNLRYETNLTVLDKLQLIQSETPDYALELERGVEHKAQEIRQLLQEAAKSMGGGAQTLAVTTLKPQAYFYESGAALVVWYVEGSVGATGRMTAAVDDATGALLELWLEEDLNPAAGYSANALLSRALNLLRENLGLSQIHLVGDSLLQLTDENGTTVELPVFFSADDTGQPGMLEDEEAPAAEEKSETQNASAGWFLLGFNR